LKKGNGATFPQKGDLVHVFYTGKLVDGTVFDSNMASAATKKKAPEPLKFRVGTGKVIRGWDHGLLTMSLGETGARRGGLERSLSHTR
jgi:FK506-binding protein 3